YPAPPHRSGASERLRRGHTGTDDPAAKSRTIVEEVFGMKRSLKFSIVLSLVLLAVGLSRSPVPSRHAKLEFVPLIQLAPHDADQNGTVPPACITPAPVSRFRLFHCYRPSDIFAAYGVDQLHAQGITGK